MAETQKAFTDWRLKNKQGERIPDELWEKALALLPHFTIGKLVRVLKVDRISLKRQAAKAGVSVEETKTRTTKTAKKRVEKKQIPHQFFELAQPVNQVLPDAVDRWHLKVTRQDGSRLEIDIPRLNDTSLQALIGHFMGG